MESKGNYQQQLRGNVERLIGSVFQRMGSTGKHPSEQVLGKREMFEEEFYRFAREVALESFKNGKKAGQQHKNAPQVRSALETGRAEPVK